MNEFLQNRCFLIGASSCERLNKIRYHPPRPPTSQGFFLGVCSLQYYATLGGGEDLGMGPLSH